jgi:hypothetical protein
LGVDAKKIRAQLSPSARAIYNSIPKDLPLRLKCFHGGGITRAVRELESMELVISSWDKKELCISRTSDLTAI